MNLFFLLGSDNASSGTGGWTSIFSYTGDSAAIKDIVSFLNTYLVPFTIILCVAGAIMAIVLAAAMIREEDLKKAADFKKKLIGMVVTILVVIVLVWLLGWLISSYETIIATLKGAISF